MTPRRIQRKRTKGWGMPENTVYVGRPTKWGNPFIPGKDNPFIPDRKVEDLRHAVCLYRAHATLNKELVEAAKFELRGKDLACWCPLNQPCHADVLLELANPSPPSSTEY
jgi:hypothetical protein